jgi:YggT family protein
VRVRCVSTTSAWWVGAYPLQRQPLKRLEELMRAILDIVMVVLNLYTWIIIAGAVLSWLIAFGVVNIRNDFVRSIWNLFLALTEPFLRPIRNFLPSTGGIDISPIILLLAVMLIERIIIYYIYPNVF